MSFRISRDKLIIFAYFIGVILTGSFLLMLPFAWDGAMPLGYVDALFTSTSAVCVTGLITVDTALYTRFGQIVIAALIQAGGLGLVTFAILYVVSPRRKISLVNTAIIKDYYLEEIEYDPKVIIRNILAITFAIEAIGAAFLYWRFRNVPGAPFMAVFHAISAFCNAGFSTFSSNLEGYVGDATVNITIMLLIISGGLGFIVIGDIRKRLLGEKKRLSTHSRIALAVTAALVMGGAVFFFLLEYGHSMKGLPLGSKVLASFFASVTPRTAGFDTIIPSKFSDASILVTIVLMFIGASPGSTGGGIKTTTFFVLVMTALRGVDDDGHLNIGKRAISSATILKAVGILGKGVMIIMLSTTAILLLERVAVVTGKIGLVEVLYEVVSAFGTVGLSLGITADLTSAAKLVLVFTMFSGRVGLFAMSLPSAQRRLAQYARLPEADVMVG